MAEPAGSLVSKALGLYQATSPKLLELWRPDSSSLSPAEWSRRGWTGARLMLDVAAQHVVLSWKSVGLGWLPWRTRAAAMATHQSLGVVPGAGDTQAACLSPTSSTESEPPRTGIQWEKSGKKANTPVLIEIQSQSSETGKHAWKSREASASVPSFCFGLNFRLRSAGPPGGCGQCPGSGRVRARWNRGWGGGLLARPLEWLVSCSCPPLQECRGARVGPVFILKAPGI